MDLSKNEGQTYWEQSFITLSDPRFIMRYQKILGTQWQFLLPLIVHTCWLYCVSGLRVMQKGLPAMGAPDAFNRNEMFMAPARLLSSHLGTYNWGGGGGRMEHFCLYQRISERTMCLPSIVPLVRLSSPFCGFFFFFCRFKMHYFLPSSRRRWELEGHPPKMPVRFRPGVDIREMDIRQ